MMKTELLQIFSGEQNIPYVSADENTVAENETETNTSSDNLPEKTPEEEFEELIKGKYSDAFKKRTQGIIDRRFSKMKGYEKTLSQFAPLVAELEKRFPDIEKGNVEKLVSSFIESTGKQVESDKRKKELRTLTENLLQQKNAQKLKETLLEDSEKLKEIYPSFDLKTELASNEELGRLILAGVPLRRAFEAVNLEKIMGTAMRFAYMTAGNKTAEIMKNPGRIPENSLLDNASSVRHTDVNSLTEKEIKKILSAVSHGARITF